MKIRVCFSLPLIFILIVLLILVLIRELFQTHTSKDKSGHVASPYREIRKKSSPNHANEAPACNYKPTFEYEATRRDLENDLSELGNMIRGLVSSTNYPTSGVIQDLFELVTSHVRKLPQKDGYQEFRVGERANLGSIVQKRIEALQNPRDCATAKKLLCHVDKNNCGFGCIVHHVVYCLITAYATSRTLILNLTDHYSGPKWNQTFLPLSHTCIDTFGLSHGTWDAGDDSVQVLSVGTFETMGKNTPWANFLPPAIPSDIAFRLERVSSEPAKWWTGQFATYILRLTETTKEIITDAKVRHMFHKKLNSIIKVGIHVRRTDKIGSEAKSYPLNQYIGHVEQYLAIQEKMEARALTAHIFLASDEPKVIQEAKKLEMKSRRSRLKILANESNAQKAATRNRFRNGMLGILTDILLLAECEFVVCTYSSNICRLVAELKEAKAEEPGSVLSLDFSYHFIAMSPADYLNMGVVLVARFDHFPSSNKEIELAVGDLIITVAPSHNGDGMWSGRNERTNKTGLFPTYKSRIYMTKFDFPMWKWWSSSLDF